MIDDLPLRWVVTVLFGLTAGVCLARAFVGQRWWPRTTSSLLHAAMSVAMAVMAWPAGAALPTTPPMIFFLLAAAWFVVVSLTPAAAGRRVATASQVLMMLAMAWMYAMMAGGILAEQAPGIRLPGMPDVHMPGFSHDGLGLHSLDEDTDDVVPATGRSRDIYPLWVLGLNGLCVVGFAGSALYWFYRYLAAPQDETSAALQDRLGVLCQAMMAGGVATMFGLML